MKSKFTRLFLLHAALVLTLLQGGAAMARIEEPAFDSIKKEGDFEVRQYRGFIVAETFVKGDMNDAGSEAFRAIAGYIFGGNISASANSSEKIAMTAPVTMEKTTSEKIAMTAPVVMEKSMEKSADENYRVHFVMPSQYTMQTLPKPVNLK